MYAFFIALSSRLAKISRRALSRGLVVLAEFPDPLSSQKHASTKRSLPRLTDFQERTHPISTKVPTRFQVFSTSGVSKILTGTRSNYSVPPQPFFAATGGIRKLNWRQRLGLPNSANFIFARFIARFLRIRFFLIRCCLLISLPRT
jgi:hypothetical protein